MIPRVYMALRCPMGQVKRLPVGDITGNLGDRMRIYYRKLPAVFKYELTRPVSVQTPLRPEAAVECHHGILHADGVLDLSAGFSWDGPSGPAVDTADFMAGSMIHDWLYRAMRYGFLKKTPANRKLADEACLSICREDGMPWWRRAWVWAALRAFAGYAVDEDVPDEQTAP